MTEDDEKLERFVRLFRPPCPWCRVRMTAMNGRACPECGREPTMQSVLRSMAQRTVPPRIIVLDIVIGVVLLLTIAAYVPNMNSRHADTGGACVMFLPLALLVVGRVWASRATARSTWLEKLPPLADYLVGDDVPCPQCKYNLRGLTGNRCPECDHLLLVSELLQREMAKIGLSPGEAVHGAVTGVLVWVAVIVVVLGVFWMFTTWWAALAALAVLAGLALWRGGVKAVRWVLRRNAVERDEYR